MGAIEKRNPLLLHLINESEKGTRKINISINQLFYEFELNGIRYRHNVTVEMDTEKLKMWFALKQKTTLYVDKNDPEIQYLDLEFMEN